MFADKLKTFFRVNSVRLISTGVIILITIVLITILKIMITRFIKRSKNRRAVTLARLVQSILRYTIFIIAVIALIGVWGFDVTTLLAGAGIMGLIIGLGAQELIKDLLSGISIVFEDSYEIDDIIEIEDFKGRVVEIGLRSTKILNWKGELRIINNGEIKQVTNFSRHFSVANIFVLVSYKENIEKVTTMLEEKLSSMKELYPQIVEGPNVSGVTSLGINGFEVNITAKTLPERHYEVERGLRKTIKDLFDANKIRIPVTQVEIHNER
jgi:small conductance mechanosensitive channel